MEIYEKILELKKMNKPFVVATVVSSEGSVPGKPGFKMIIDENSITYGTVGGGAIEMEVIKETVRLLSGGKSYSKKYILSDEVIQNDVDEKVVPMMCSGKVTIFFEVHGQKPTIYVFGGGHVGQSLLYYLSPLSFHTILIDNRPEFANKEKNPFASECILSDYPEYANTFTPSNESYIVILTHGHKFDNDILNIIYKRELKVQYVGVISSKAKAAKMVEKLKANSIDKFDLSILHSPVGLDIGGNSPAEIALAIAAEIQAVHYGKLADEIIKTCKL